MERGMEKPYGFFIQAITWLCGIPEFWHRRADHYGADNSRQEKNPYSPYHNVADDADASYWEYPQVLKKNRNLCGGKRDLV